MLAMEVHINPSITALLGNKDTNLTCSFAPEKGEQIFYVEVIAKNITDEFDVEKKIVSFNTYKGTSILTSGKYLSDRVTLTNITSTSTYATLTFHKLNCTDEKDYMCKCFYFGIDGSLVSKTSAPTRIIIKGNDFFLIKRSRSFNSLCIHFPQWPFPKCSHLFTKVRRVTDSYCFNVCFYFSSLFRTRYHFLNAYNR